MQSRIDRDARQTHRHRRVQQFIDDAIHDFPRLLKAELYDLADEAAYNITIFKGSKIPKVVADHLFQRNEDNSWVEAAPCAGLAMGVLLATIENDRASQGVAAQNFMACLQNADATIAGRAHFHLAELMLKDRNPSDLLLSRIERCLEVAVQLNHPEATMLLGTLYAHGQLNKDGEPDPEKAAALYVKVIEELKVPSAKRLLLALLERHPISVEGYPLDVLRGEAGLH